MGRTIPLFLMAMLLNSLKAKAQLHLQKPGDSLEKTITLRPLPQNFYTQHMGYFCKKELQLQKTTSLPLYIRLGSKEYVDALERKPNSSLKNHNN